MKGSALLIFSSILFGLASCGGGNDKSTESVKAVQKTDSCEVDLKHSYEVYIPERNDSDEILPLLVIIDAHGGGKFALDKFKQAANEFPTILVASNLVKNGFGNYEAAIQTLVDDVRKKYPVAKTVFMTGFSGGARMALGYALSHQINGLILCGALANADQINALHCTVFSISGMDDFNFMETVQYLFDEALIPNNLKIELTNSSHNWPDSPTLANVFGYLYLSGQTITPLMKSKLAVYCESQHARIDSLKEEEDYLKATLVARYMSNTSPFNGDKTFISSYDDLKDHPEYANQLNRLKNSLTFEINARQPYMNAFLTEDTVWWKREIETIDEKIKNERDSYKEDMYRRIKAFWGIACYSLSSQAAREKDTEKLDRIIPIYRMLEPENPDMFYFSAYSNFLKGNNDRTISLLKKATGAGFSDIGQIKETFPESITAKINP